MWGGGQDESMARLMHPNGRPLNALKDRTRASVPPEGPGRTPASRADPLSVRPYSVRGTAAYRASAEVPFPTSATSGVAARLRRAGAFDLLPGLRQARE